MQVWKEDPEMTYEQCDEPLIMEYLRTHIIDFELRIYNGSLGTPKVN